MTLFVTGASGYLGGVLARHLLRHDRLRLLVRRPERLGDLQRSPGVEVVEGDLLVKGPWEEKLDGCDGVLHLAALVTQWAPTQRFLAVNREAFRNLLELSWRRRIPKFIYTSSLFALGPSEGSFDQRLWRSNAYAHSKREALLLAREYQKRGFPLIILIPTVVYGPGTPTEGNHLSLLLEELMEDRLPPLPDHGKWIWNFAFVDDVAEGHRLALEKGRGGQEYVLGGASVSMEAFFATASRLLDQPRQLRSAPSWALEGYALFEELRASLSRHPPRLTRGALALYRHHWDYQDQKAREELGYRPRTLEEGLRRTLEWLRSMTKD